MRYLEQDIAVTGQQRPDDLQTLKEQGFKSIINNRPDGEMAGQPTSNELSALAEELGLTYVHIPMAGNISMELLDHSKMAYETLPKPILAFCNSGPRSAALWCFANAERLGVDEVIEITSAQGFQTAQLRSMLLGYLEQSKES